MQTKHDEPAFPLKEPLTSDQTGMTLRDYFAAKAMQALISTATGPIVGGLDGYEQYCAEGSYKMADAMMQARGE